MKEEKVVSGYFSGKDLYVGLDVHKKRPQVCSPYN